MRDLSWKFFHRWWQPKLHHIILEAEAKGDHSVHLSAEEWAAASARAGGGGGGGGSSRRKKSPASGTSGGGGIGGRSATVRQGPAVVGGGVGESRGIIPGGSVGSDDVRIEMELDYLERGATVAAGGGAGWGGVHGRFGGVGPGDGGGDGGNGGDGEGREKPASFLLAAVPNFSGDIDFPDGGRAVQAQGSRGGDQEGPRVSLEDTHAVGMEVGREREKRGLGPGGEAGGGAVGSGHHTAADAYRRNTEAMSSRPSSYGTGGEEEVEVTGSMPLSMSRSRSWVSFRSEKGGCEEESRCCVHRFI